MIEIHLRVSIESRWALFVRCDVKMIWDDEELERPRRDFELFFSDTCTRLI